MGCETIVQVFFHMLLNIKLYHWETNIYARHKASDDLHGALSTLIDTFVEVYMGRYTRPEFKNTFDVKVKQLDDLNIVDILNGYIKFLKYEVPKYTKESDTDLLNIRDEMLSEINKTLYLFTLN
jgi:Family of unknown function (DUF5856)